MIKIGCSEFEESDLLRFLDRRNFVLYNQDGYGRKVVFEEHFIDVDPFKLRYTVLQEDVKNLQTTDIIDFLYEFNVSGIVIKIGCSYFHEQDLLRLKELKNFMLYETHGYSKKVTFFATHIRIGQGPWKYDLLDCEPRDLHGISYGKLCERFAYEQTC